MKEGFRTIPHRPKRRSVESTYVPEEYTGRDFNGWISVIHKRSNGTPEGVAALKASLERTQHEDIKVSAR